MEVQQQYEQSHGITGKNLDKTLLYKSILQQKGVPKFSTGPRLDEPCGTYYIRFHPNQKEGIPKFLTNPRLEEPCGRYNRFHPNLLPLSTHPSIVPQHAQYVRGIEHFSSEMVSE